MDQDYFKRIADKPTYYYSRDIITNGTDPMKTAKEAEKQLNDLFETYSSSRCKSGGG